MKKIIKLFTNSEDGNLAYHVNDDKLNVDKNHQDLALKHDYQVKDLRYMNQVHGNHIEIVTHQSPLCIKKCDAVITKEVDLPLMVMVADCIPILMYDKIQGVIAAIHAGRNSTFLNIAGLCAQKMIEEFACQASNIEVEMGPSIQKCCYEVSSEMATIVKTSFGEEFVQGRMIDLQGINKSQLQLMGIKNIMISPICTKCSNKPYFSYRQNNNTGRFAGVIMLKKP